METETTFTITQTYQVIDCFRRIELVNLTYSYRKAIHTTVNKLESL